MDKEFKRMMELAGLNEIKITQPVYDVVKFLNSNKDAIFDAVGVKYSANDDELNNAKEHLKFQVNNDGINTVYSTTTDNPDFNMVADSGVFAFLFVSPDKKQFIEQILYDFDLNREEEINWDDEGIAEITPLNIGGKTIYYTIIEY